jgi:SpoVK/Ycf46/Vps4 family AAA+-type ATPase
VATESKLPLFRFSCSELYGVWRHEGEKKLREFFQEAKKHAPAILFVDEVDRVDGFLERDNEGEASRRLKVEFLIQMEQRDPNVYVIAATERPWDICPAVRRRLEQRLLVDFPNLDARVKIFKQHLAPVLHDVTDEDFIEVSRLASNYTAYDIYDVVRSASMIPFRAVSVTCHILSKF